MPLDVPFAMRAQTLVSSMLLAVLVAAPSTAVDDVPMTQEQAATFYLTQACKTALARERMVDRVWGQRETISLSDVRRNLDRYKEAAEKYGRARLRFATKMLNPPAPWPIEVGDHPSSLAAANIKHGTLWRRAGAAANARQWWRLTGRGDKVKFGTHAATIRAVLNLPPSGKGC